MATLLGDLRRIDVVEEEGDLGPQYILVLLIGIEDVLACLDWLAID